MPDFVLSPELEATRPQAAMYVGDSGETTSSWVGRQVERLNKVEGDDSSADFKQLFRRQTLFDFVNVLEGKSSVWNADVTSEDRAAMTAAVERIQPQILEAAAAPVAAAPVAATDIPVPASAEIPKTAAPAVQTLDPQTLEVARALNARVKSEGWDRVGVGFVTENFPALDRPAAETVFANLQKAGILGEQVDNGVFGPANLINRDALQAAVASSTVNLEASGTSNTKLSASELNTSQIDTGLPSGLAVLPVERRAELSQAPLFANPDALVQIDGAKPAAPAPVEDPLVPYAVRAVDALRKKGETELEPEVFLNELRAQPGLPVPPDSVDRTRAASLLDTLEKQKHVGEEGLFGYRDILSDPANPAPAGAPLPATEDDRYKDAVKRLQENWYQKGETVTVTPDQLVTYGMANDADEAKRFVQRLQDDKIVGAPNEAGEHIILEPKKAAPEAAPVVAAPVAEGQDPLYARAVQVVDEMHAKGTAQVSPMTLLQDLQRQPDLPASDQPLDVKRSKALLEAMEQNGVVGPADGIGWRDIVAPENRPVAEAAPAAPTPVAPVVSEEDKRYNAAVAHVDERFINDGIRAVAPSTLVKDGVAADEPEAKKMLARMVKDGVVEEADPLGYHSVVEASVKRRNPAAFENDLSLEPLDPVEAERLRQERARRRQDQQQGPEEEEGAPGSDGTRRRTASGGSRPDPVTPGNGGGGPFDQTNGHFHPEDYKKIMEHFSHKEGHVLDHEHTDKNLVIHTATGKVTITQEKLIMHGSVHDHESYRASTLTAGHLWGGGKANGGWTKDHQITAVAYGQAYDVKIVPTKNMNAKDLAEIHRIRREIEHDYADDPLLKINKGRQAETPTPQNPRDRQEQQTENSYERMQPTPV